MKRNTFHLIKALLISTVFLAAACSGSAAIVTKSKIILIGSTPAAAEIRMPLSIDGAKPVDFIRWDLGLDGTGAFVLNINFGEGEPNTRGFKNGGESRTIRGTYRIFKDANGDTYRFTVEKGEFSLRKIGENIFHILTTDGKLMPSTGGWGYTLTRKDRVVGKAELVSQSKTLLNETAAESVFVGRTPCVDLGRADLPFTDGCLKLKWKLTLRRDPRTNRPSSYMIESTLNRRQSVEGKWTLINGTHENPRALILQLDPDTPDKKISFLVGDENVIFFLNKEHQLLAGNEDFGFSFSRRRDKE